VFCLQAHLNQGPAAALNVLSSCRHLNGIEGCTVDLSTMVLKDFDLWPVFDLSPHEFRNAALWLSRNNFASLPEQVTKAWVHTLALSHCSGLNDITALGGCGSLHTLDLSYCFGLVDISALGGCGSLHTLSLSSCRGLVDISALGGCGSLHTLTLGDCPGLVDISALGGCGSLRKAYLRCCSGLKGVTFPGVEVIA
jgi:hypothetical protein